MAGFGLDAFGRKNTLAKVLAGAAITAGVIAGGVFFGLYLRRVRFERRTPYQRDARRKDRMDTGDYAVGI